MDGKCIVDSRHTCSVNPETAVTFTHGHYDRVVLCSDNVYIQIKCMIQSSPKKFQEFMGGPSFAQATTNSLWVNLITRNEASQLFQSVYWELKAKNSLHFCWDQKFLTMLDLI